VAQPPRTSKAAIASKLYSDLVVNIECLARLSECHCESDPY
jgi:hypothetical protein